MSEKAFLLGGASIQPIIESPPPQQSVDINMKGEGGRGKGVGGRGKGYLRKSYFTVVQFRFPAILLNPIYIQSQVNNTARTLACLYAYFGAVYSGT